ncbi:hypothetical protein HPB51_001979 [Rhipicephalus microplus]|uniref:Uncharacterized protein n=1 Tax=Rhipicephalus microplus TaxID=6941 RepID=A0A9J6DKQ8_RHIMP|nr:hypothetical protein HPB51_001979 [Rhipicephalus microplus]
MLSDVASQSGDPLANVGSNSVDFGRFTRYDKEGVETKLAEIRLTTKSVTHNAPASRDANREAPPHVALTRAATVNESAGKSLPSSKVLLQNALSDMQSLASALQNKAPCKLCDHVPRKSRAHYATSAPDFCGALQGMQVPRPRRAHHRGEAHTRGHPRSWHDDVALRRLLLAEDQRETATGASGTAERCCSTYLRRASPERCRGQRPRHEVPGLPPPQPNARCFLTTQCSCQCDLLLP